MPTIRLVVLTKSSKFGGYCVAGLNFSNGAWIRLVSKDKASHGALLNQHIKYADGTEIELLDVIKVEVLGKDNNILQPENYLIDTNTNFIKTGKMNNSQFFNFCIPDNNDRFIFGNTDYYVPAQNIVSVGKSLTLVQVQNFKIYQKRNRTGKLKTKASFIYNGYTYTNMSVTDPNIYMFQNTINQVIFPKARVVLSLGTPVNAQYYKFVAAVYL